ncbi:MAG: bifunctional metallophosphatase/5'-nucleotidase [Myxococcota bacterium]
MTLAFLLACAHTPDAPAAPRTFAVLAFNDLYRVEGDVAEGGLARIRALRADLAATYPDLLVVGAGDFLFPSLLSRTFEGAQMIDVLNGLDGSAGWDERMILTFGNHEMDAKDASVLDARLEESGFTWVTSNVTFAPEVASPNLARLAYRHAGGVKVGFFGLTVDSNPKPWVLEYADPVEAARGATAELRANGAEVVIAVTHLPVEQDEALLRALGSEGPDLVLGGHEHVAHRREVDGRLVLKADAEGRSATLARVTVSPDGRVEVADEKLVPHALPPDPAVAELAAGWVARHEAEYCERKLLRPAGCLEEVLGRAAVELVATEDELRGGETAFGAWIADLARAHFPEADVAFVHAGTLRLDRDLPAGAAITRRTIEELFAYPAKTQLVRIDGATLQAVAARSVRDGPGKGHWLLVSGFGFRHAGGVAGPVHLLRGTPRAVRPEEPLLAVTLSYLTDPSTGQDGYTMLSPAQVVREGSDLKDLAIAALGAAGAAGIAPVAEGRVCGPGDGRCAVPRPDP